MMFSANPYCLHYAMTALVNMVTLRLNGIWLAIK